jgi:hypothetical protein
MAYTIRYNRTTNHIDGISARTTGGGNDMGSHVSDYSLSACGALTRGRFGAGKSFESLADALEAARLAGGRKLCKTCEKAALAQIAAEAVPAHDPEGCDLDCDVCFPEYIPEVGQYVKTTFGNVWRVMSTDGRFIELRHVAHGHYASEPKTETGGFQNPHYRQVPKP